MTSVYKRSRSGEHKINESRIFELNESFTIGELDAYRHFLAEIFSLLLSIFKKDSCFS
jgi:hypothetical protein